MSNMLNVSMSLPRGMVPKDLNRKTVMKGLKEATKIVSKQAKKLCGKKMTSKSGELPGKKSGKLRKAIKNHSAKNKSEKLWSRTQFDTIPDHFFYPAPLFYGRKETIKTKNGKTYRVGMLIARKNPVILATKMTENQTESVIKKAVLDGMKGD